MRESSDFLQFYARVILWLLHTGGSGKLCLTDRDTIDWGFAYHPNKPHYVAALIRVDRFIRGG